MPQLITEATPEILIEKAPRQLSLYQGGQLLFRCPIGLGSAPLGHKTREGDGRTPEGRYMICTRNPESRFHLALGLNYPNAADAQAALAAGCISPEAAAAIIAAEQAGKRPPWDTPLGGQIMIHGQRPGQEERAGSDWTAGCISLANEDMERLWQLCPLGTPVQILP